MQKLERNSQIWVTNRIYSLVKWLKARVNQFMFIVQDMWLKHFKKLYFVCVICSLMKWRTNVYLSIFINILTYPCKFPSTWECFIMGICSTISFASCTLREVAGYQWPIRDTRSPTAMRMINLLLKDPEVSLSLANMNPLLSISFSIFDPLGVFMTSSLTLKGSSRDS